MLIFMIMGVALFLAAVFAVRALLIIRGLPGEAKSEYDHRKAAKMISADVTETDFISAYKRVHGARSALYAAGTLFAVAALTPLLLRLLEFLYNLLWIVGGQQREFEPGWLVWQFMLFAGVIAGWALIGFIGARFYYAKLPGSLEMELNRKD